MHPDQLPFFLDRAREWWAVADTLRACGVPPDHPALGVWREAAWCHLLLVRGRYPAIVSCLRRVLREMTGSVAPAPSPLPASAAEALCAAADLFPRLRSTVASSYPIALSQLSAACPAA